MSNKKILVTGSAGFIGFHLVSRFLKEVDFDVWGIDIINSYYDVNLKYLRLAEHGINAEDMIERETRVSNKYSNYHFLKADIADHDFIVDFMINEKFDYVINLAAQAGVRYSIDNPRAYTHSNIDGFLSILEGARYSKVKHLIYASSSSVYGLNTGMPLSEVDSTEHPMAMYAATKKANEMMAHSYSHLFRLPTTGLRFFTVYGPWGRPDMALFLFAEAIVNKKSINVFNNGNMIRDFTFVDDVVESIFKLTIKPAESNLEWNGNDPHIPTSSAPYQIFNIGNSAPVRLMDYIEALENEFGIKAIKKFLKIQPGDVPSTHADTKLLKRYIDFCPQTPIQMGIRKFAEWYKFFYS
jgi:UDP-glucuronate 4-epimerase